VGVGMRVLFCAAVAVMAAAFADPLVELASNVGLFGPVSFTDHSNADVLPSLAVGVLLICLLAAFRATGLLNRARFAISHRASQRLLPATFAIQLATLFSMETIEQYVTTGHFLGGLIWLGGPIVISLAVHALFCIAATYSVSRAIQTVAHAVVRIVRILRGFTLLPACRNAPQFGRSHEFVLAHDLIAIPCRIGKRAPPVLVR
jgi:hypothetical protein